MTTGTGGDSQRDANQLRFASAWWPEGTEPENNDAESFPQKAAKKFKATPPTGSDPVERASKIIALVVSLAAFVYIAGAAVLAVRLDKAGLPASEVVTGLPRELLIGVGLQNVVAPTLALALVAGIEIFVLKRWAKRKTHRWFGLVVALTVGLGLAAIILWALLSLQRGSWLISLRDPGLGEFVVTSGWWAAFLVASVATLGIYWVVKGRHETFLLVALIAFSAGLIAAAVRVVYERKNLRLEDVAVCVNDGGHPYQGWLIGETSDAVYVGEKFHKVVVAIPRDRVGELQIGAKAHPNTCHPVPIQEAQGRRET